MADEIYIDGVTDAIITRISEKVTARVEEKLLAKLQDLIPDDLPAAVSGEISREMKALFEKNNEKNTELTTGYQNTVKTLAKTLENRLSEIENSGRSDMKRLNNNIRIYLEGIERGDPEVSKNLETVIIREFIRLHEAFRASDEDSNRLQVESISILQDIESGLKQDRTTAMKFEKQLVEALHTIDDNVRTLEQNKGEMIQGKALDTFRDWIITINEEIKKTRIIAETAFKEKSTAIERLQGIQDLWDKQVGSKSKH
ncbi:hypothetical protein H8E50_03835 [bacterium]|nr:hypothetical protein [bacterium]